MSIVASPVGNVNIGLTLYTLFAKVLPVNEVQQKLADLEGKGWSLAAIADEVGATYNAAQKWKSGARHPANAKAVLQSLDALRKRRRIPKKRRSNRPAGAIR